MEDVYIYLSCELLPIVSERSFLDAFYAERGPRLETDGIIRYRDDSALAVGTVRVERDGEDPRLFRLHGGIEEQKHELAELAVAALRRLQS